MEKTLRVPRRDDAVPGSVLDELTRLALETSADPARLAALRGVRIYVEPEPTAVFPVLFDPVLYVVLQGGKQLLLDDRVVRYDRSQLVIVTVDLPALAQVLQATPQTPYVAVEISLNPGMLTELARHLPAAPSRPAATVSAHPAPVGIYDPLGRMLRMSEDPRAAELFGAEAVREIAYHVLVSPQGDALRQLAGPRGAMAHIALATRLMTQNYARPLGMPELAARTNLSVTSLHRHFKAQTGTTPLEYYKRLRLHEARRLNSENVLNATEIAAAVGYASLAHFSRDYKRMFGLPPSRDLPRPRGAN